MHDPRFQTDVSVTDKRIVSVTFLGVPVQAWGVILLMFALGFWALRACSTPPSNAASAPNFVPHNAEIEKQARGLFGDAGTDEATRVYALDMINTLLTAGEYECAAEGFWAIGQIPMWKQVQLYERDQLATWNQARKYGSKEPRPRIQKERLLRERRMERTMCGALCNLCHNVANDPHNVAKRKKLLARLRLYSFSKAADAEAARIATLPQ